MMEYSPSEFMITHASRALEGNRVVFVGVGMPNIACNLARHDHSPHLELIYESGVFGARPARLPLSIGDPTLVSGAISVMSMADLFLYYLQGGRVDVALLGGAQIDRYGNLNTTVIGDYAKPKVRLPGSGGACEIATNARKVLVIMRLSKRAFVEKLDFATSVGHTSQGMTREQLGLPGKGPQMVITDRALFAFDDSAPEMILTQIAPGETVESIQAEVGWELRVSPDLETMEAPTETELAIIRDKLDTKGLYR